MTQISWWGEGFVVFVPLISRIKRFDGLEDWTWTLKSSNESLVRRESSSWRKKSEDGPNGPSGWTWRWCSVTRSLSPGSVRSPGRITGKPISTSTWSETPTLSLHTHLLLTLSVLKDLTLGYNQSHCDPHHEILQPFEMFLKLMRFEALTITSRGK